MKIISKIFFTVSLSFLNLIGFAQCATCKAAAETSLENGDSTIASGINIGVLYMLFILFTIFGLFIFLVWKHRNADGHISQ
jgi:heme/copper-type cytochrome/quinol oxidase subunit 2